MNQPESVLVKPANTRDRRTLRLILFVLIAVCILFIIGYVQRLQEKAAVFEQAAAVQTQIAEEKQQQAILTDALAEAGNPAHVAEIARDDMGLVKPGDQVVVLIDPTPTVEVTPSAPPPAGVRGTQPPWRQWFDLIFAGGG